jgi:GntR family transcriptional regulator, vanillate catabolism transcriptional regulator
MPPSDLSPDLGDAPGTRQQQVVDRLRDWAVGGVLDPGAKFSEAELADRLGVSRTPIRHAVAVLVEEGVLVRAGGRGYRVRSYRAQDVLAAVELRALTEGYAARKLAQSGLDPAGQAALNACLAEGDALFLPGQPVDEAAYGAMNRRFHDLIADLAGIDLLAQVRAVFDRVPYGGPDAIRFDGIAPDDRALHLQHSHWQHHYIVLAITQGDGARAEAILREHGELIKASLGLARGPFAPPPGRSLPIAPPPGPATRRAGREPGQTRP